MKNKLDYYEVFRAIEKAVEMKATQLLCFECGKGFFKVAMVSQDQPDYIAESGKLYTCQDHLLYDLLVNPEITEDVVISHTVNTRTKKVQVHTRIVDAQIFIPKRTN